jgi:hypothetical protein
MTQAALDAIRAALALLAHGFTDYALAILEGCARAETQPAIAMIKAGSIPRAIEWMREREQQEEQEG